MGKVYNSIAELTGHTPLLELHKLEESQAALGRIYGKLEFFSSKSAEEHFSVTGPEIWEDLDGKIDILIATGDALAGAGKYLKSKNNSIRLVAIAPADEADIWDEVISVTESDARAFADLVAQREGFFIGNSSGASVWAASLTATRKENKGKNIVVIIPDFGEKNLNSIRYNAEEPLDVIARERGVKERPLVIKNEIDERGAFIRQKNSFVTPFGDGEGELRAAAGKYRLYWMKGCHWSNRASIVRELLGLEDAISVQIAAPTGLKNKYGWGFPQEENQEDPVTGFKFLSEAYFNADPNFSKRATVPALVDVETKKVVNNDYHRLTNYFEVNFRPFQPEDAPDLYPEPLRKEIDRFNEWLFPNINDAHYRMAFCQSLEAYKEAFDDFVSAMEKLDNRLATNRFLFGDYVTDSDVRFFVTLARWDSHYYRNLGPQRRRISDYKNIWDYARDLYEIPAFRNNTYFRDFSREKRHGSFDSFPARFTDDIPFEEIWSAPQNRKVLSRTPDEKFLRHKKGE